MSYKTSRLDCFKYSCKVSRLMAVDVAIFYHIIFGVILLHFKMLHCFHTVASFQGLLHHGFCALFVDRLLAGVVKHLVKLELPIWKTVKEIQRFSIMRVKNKILLEKL